MVGLKRPGQDEERTALEAFRRYVTHFVNCHDFGALPDIMAEDYALRTQGLVISGRDGPYRAAVAKQLEQFPGLVFTPHELFHVENRLAVRFSEHGASLRHGGNAAAWSNIAIYTVRKGRLAGCSIEQDYYSRREQLERGRAAAVDPPPTSPWDVPASHDDPQSAGRVREWLQSARYLDQGNVRLDGMCSGAPRIIADGDVEVLDLLAGDNRVAFHAVHRGTLAGDFPSDQAPARRTAAFIHMSGFVHLKDGEVERGHIVRDRWGLFRRLSSARPLREREL